MSTIYSTTTSPVLPATIRRLEAEAAEFTRQAEAAKAANLAEYAVRMNERARQALEKAEALRRTGRIRAKDLLPKPYYLYTMIFKDHRLCVAEARARRPRRGRVQGISGKLLIFVERGKNGALLSQDDVIDAVDCLADRLNEQADITSEWLQAENITFDEVMAVRIPGGYVVDAEYTGDFPTQPDDDQYEPGEWEWLTSRGIH
jgi:hypothetical protein